MLDYKGLEALYTIINTQSFEKAAQTLFITQPAVSQRLKSLEKYYGEALLIRALPYKPTKLGEILLGHFKRLLSLEEMLAGQISDAKVRPKLSIAISRDMLETWFLNLLCDANLFDHALLEAIADDQDITHEYMRKGLVSSCITTHKEPISGCQTIKLGTFDYCLVASPSFLKTYFQGKKHNDNLLQAPTLIFDTQDKLHQDYLRQYFNIEERPQHIHTLPSVHGFKRFVMQGYGYGLLPKVDIQSDLATGKLVEIFKHKRWRMPIYWHSWAIESELEKTFREFVMAYVKHHLR